MPKYTPKMVEQICGYIAQGKTYADACKIVGISESEFYKWKSELSEFSEAIKRAEQEYKDWYSKDLVESAKKSLKELVLGWECEEVTTEYISDPNNPDQPKIKQQRRVKKKYKPDATAIIFALTNKAPDEFKNRQYQEGKMTQEIVRKPDLSAIPDELLDQVLNALDEQAASSDDSAEV